MSVVHTDGACSGTPGPGGWAWVADDGRQGYGNHPSTTNQRMELQAVYEALLAVEGPIVVVSDSRYVVNCFLDKWYLKWFRKNWRTERGPVANRDLWEPLLDLYQNRTSVHFVHVRGHSGDEWNERVDKLAVVAKKQLMSFTYTPATCKKKHDQVMACPWCGFIPASA